MVTEKMDSTLKDRYTAGMSVQEQLGVFSDIAAGLAYIHREGVIHRDLTSRNVLLNRHGRAKISDVGVSKSLHGDSVVGGLTRCPGTPLYMPPEALADRPEYDDRLDSFSFGVLMMAVIVNREPSSSLLLSPRSERLANGTQREIPELERRSADFNAVPATHPARELIVRCLSNNRELRPRANELYDELVSKLAAINPSQRLGRGEVSFCLKYKSSYLSYESALSFLKARRISSISYGTISKPQSLGTPDKLHVSAWLTLPWPS